MALRKPALLVTAIACGGGCSTGAAEQYTLTQDATTPADANSSDVRPPNDAAGGLDALDAASDVSCSLPLSESEHAARVQVLHDSLVSQVVSFERKFVGDAGTFACPAPTSQMWTHDFGDYALAKYVLSSPSDPAALGLAESAIRCMFTFEDTTPGSATYGVFRFHLSDPPRVADNSNEFALFPVSALVALWPALAQRLAGLVPDIRAALDVLEAHTVCPGYTNICLMQAAAVTGAGQWLAASPDASTAAYGAARVASGKQRLDEWISFTRDAGVTEFDSVTYGEVDLDTLLVTHAIALDPALRAETEAVLGYLWSDFSANTFVARQSLGGPHSRTYDFFTEQGPISYSLYLEGLRTNP